MVKQAMPKGLVVRALKHYRKLLLAKDRDTKQDGISTLCEQDTNDLFDTCSEIVLYEEASKIELTFAQSLYKNFNQHSLDGVDYPLYSNDLPLVVVQEEEPQEEIIVSNWIKGGVEVELKQDGCEVNLDYTFKVPIWAYIKWPEQFDDEGNVEVDEPWYQQVRVHKLETTNKGLCCNDEVLYEYWDDQDGTLKKCRIHVGALTMQPHSKSIDLDRVLINELSLREFK